jgi:hypothetical protein
MAYAHRTAPEIEEQLAWARRLRDVQLNSVKGDGPTQAMSSASYHYYNGVAKTLAWLRNNQAPKPVHNDSIAQEIAFQQRHPEVAR